MPAASDADLLRRAAARMCDMADEAETKLPSDRDKHWCETYLRAGVRHLQRNVNLDCAEHDDTGDPSMCHVPDRYAGGHVARWDPVTARAVADLLVEQADSVDGPTLAGCRVAALFLRQQSPQPHTV